jgi:hypothetical protein
MSAINSSEEKMIHHILLSLAAFLLMVVLERIVGRLSIPMWAISGKRPFSGRTIQACERFGTILPARFVRTLSGCGK